jgi:uncharacterized membrane protein required for colicin V production
MVIFDIVFAALAALILFSYIKRGFVGSLLEFARIYIAFFLAATLGGLVGDLVVTWLPDVPAPICNAIGYVAAFLLAILLVRLVARILTELIDHIKLVGAINRLLGAVLGILVAFAFLMVISSVFKIFFDGKPIYEETTMLRFLGDSVLPSLKLFDLAGF